MVCEVNGAKSREIKGLASKSTSILPQICECPLRFCLRFARGPTKRLEPRTSPVGGLVSQWNARLREGTPVRPPARAKEGLGSASRSDLPGTALGPASRLPGALYYARAPAIPPARHACIAGRSGKMQASRHSAALSGGIGPFAQCLMSSSCMHLALLAWVSP